MGDKHNLTDADMRLLLGTAAETVPPAADLLGGVRRRLAHRRSRARVAMSVGLVGVVGAGTAVAVTAGSGTAARPQSGGTAASPLSARMQLTAVLAKAGARSYRVRAVGQQILVTKKTGEKGGWTYRDHGVFDPVHQTGKDTVTGDNAALNGQFRYIGKFLYERLDYAVRESHGKPWYRIRPGSGPGSALQAGVPPAWQYAIDLANGDGEAIGAGPGRLAAIVKSATTVRDEGPVSGTGWTGTRYSFTATIRIPPAPFTTHVVTGTVSVDQQGRVRQLAVTDLEMTPKDVPINIENTLDITFSDFGTPVSVAVPPAGKIHAGYPPNPPSERIPAIKGKS